MKLNWENNKLPNLKKNVVIYLTFIKSLNTSKDFTDWKPRNMEIGRGIKARQHVLQELVLGLQAIENLLRLYEQIWYYGQLVNLLRTYGEGLLW